MIFTIDILIKKKKEKITTFISIKINQKFFFLYLKIGQYLAIRYIVKKIMNFTRKSCDVSIEITHTKSSTTHYQKVKKFNSF